MEAVVQVKIFSKDRQKSSHLRLNAQEKFSRKLFRAILMIFCEEEGWKRSGGRECGGSGK
jgi:hypothetical protein